MANEILIVDDEADIRVLTSGILEDEGYQTRDAANSSEALAAVEARRPSMVLLDIWLQGSELDGLGILKALKENHPTIPVLMMSGHGTVENTTVADWDRVMDINAKGVFLGTKSAIPELRRAGGGSIINISSQLGLVGVDNSSPQYQASKGAVRLLTKSTAIQYAGEGIRANSVHPGPIVTPMTEAGRADPERNELTLSRIPLGRHGEPDDVAYGVLFLASDESSFMTGSELVIDGGWTAQ